MIHDLLPFFQDNFFKGPYSSWGPHSKFWDVHVFVNCIGFPLIYITLRFGLMRLGRAKYLIWFLINFIMTNLYIRPNGGSDQRRLETYTYSFKISEGVCLPFFYPSHNLVSNYDLSLHICFMHMKNMFFGKWQNVHNSGIISLFLEFEVCLETYVGIKDSRLSHTLTLSYHTFSHPLTIFTHSKECWPNVGQSYKVGYVKECALAKESKYEITRGR